MVNSSFLVSSGEECWGTWPRNHVGVAWEGLFRQIYILYENWDSAGCQGLALFSRQVTQRVLHVRSPKSPYQHDNGSTNNVLIYRQLARDKIPGRG